MKNIFLIFLIFIFSACSSKVQTNKLPNNKKYYLPDNQNYKVVKISEDELHSFNATLQDFFYSSKNNKEENNIYKIGMRYFDEN